MISSHLSPRLVFNQHLHDTTLCKSKLSSYVTTPCLLWMTYINKTTHDVKPIILKWQQECITSRRRIPSFEQEVRHTCDHTYPSYQDMCFLHSRRVLVVKRCLNRVEVDESRLVGPFESPLQDRWPWDYHSVGLGWVTTLRYFGVPRMKFLLESGSS